MKKLNSIIFNIKYPFWRDRLCDWYKCIPAGWRNAFGEDLSCDLKKAINASKKRLRSEKHIRAKRSDILRWISIKDKFGMLRLDAECSPEVQSVLIKYEKIAHVYCMCCGSKAQYITPRYTEPLCESCFFKNELSKIHPREKLAYKNECKIK